MTIEVELTPVEIWLGASVGVSRRVNAIKNNRTPVNGQPEDQFWNDHVEGALGEMALAKAFGLYWSGGVFRGDDVGPYQVRTRTKHHYDLILHKTDNDEKVFYLVTGQHGRYVIRGWIKAADGKREEYWNDKADNGRAAYFVPQAKLNPVAVKAR